MYNMYGPWPPMMFPPAQGLTLQQAIEGEEFFKQYKKTMKEKDEHERKSKRKPELRKFTFLELLGLMIICGPMVGVGYLYFFQYIMHNVNQILNVPH